jgi:PASTA domain
MTRLHGSLIIFGLLMWLGFAPATRAQADNVAVPNLAGLSVPEAAALLNRTGLNLGAEKAIPLTDTSGLVQNRVNSQSVPAGQQVARGSAVDVTVPRATNILLLYDYNELTLVNKTGFKLGLDDITFNAFAASTWQAKELEDGQCAQLWAISRSGPQAVPECAAIQTWFFTTNKANHFWRATAGSPQFAFTKGGIHYGQCDAVGADSGPMRCDLYLSDNVQDDLTDYLYFVYTAEQLIIRNKSKDEWMPLSGVNVINNLPAVKGQTFAVGDPKSYPTRAPVGRADRLAPGQCLWFTNGSPQITAPVQPCDVMARLDVNPDLIFWASDFGVDGVLYDAPNNCPKATPGKLTICAVPR